MIEPMGSRRDAASVLFNLPGYRVVDAVDEPETGVRRVFLEAVDDEAACPTCGVLTSRVHQRVLQRVRDVPLAGAVAGAVAGGLEVFWRKRRFACVEPLCVKRTFTEHTAQVPPRARTTLRLLDAVLAAVTGAGRAVSEVATAHGVSWWTVQSVVNAAAVLHEADVVPVVRRLGVDEHRYRSVRFFRDPQSGAWRRYEPWMTTFVDLDTGRLLGVVDGRDSDGVRGWLTDRSQAWREPVQVVAIDPSAAFRKALREQLPAAAVSVDAFHLVKLANDMVTTVRQRLSQQTKGRRGRTVDASWAHRRLLLRAGDTLSKAGLGRLRDTFRRDDPTDELGAAWGVKEQLRRLLKTSSLEHAHTEKMRLGVLVAAADMPETDRLWHTVRAWWPQIEVLVVTGVTNARTEAANTSIKQIKRTGRGFRNEHHYRARILLASAARVQRELQSQRTGSRGTTKSRVAGAEALDVPEARAFSGGAVRGGAGQVPVDVVQRVPGQVAVGLRATVGERAGDVGEPPQQIRRRDSGERGVVDGHPPPVVGQLGDRPDGRRQSAERVADGAGVRDVDDTGPGRVQAHGRPPRSG